MLKYEKESSLGEEELTKIYEKRQMRLVGARGVRGDDWEVESDEESRISRNHKQKRTVRTLLSSEVSLESYFEKQANWPIFISYLIVHEVILPTN